MVIKEEKILEIFINLNLQQNKKLQEMLRKLNINIKLKLYFGGRCEGGITSLSPHRKEDDFF